MSATCTLLVGLPGSGKTHVLRALREQPATAIFDDVFAHSGSGMCEDILALPELTSALEEGKRCFISDIAFCIEKRRATTETFLRALRRNLTINYIFFENNPEQCIANVLQDTSRKPEQRISEIRRCSLLYTIPDGAEVKPIWRVRQ